tara:strand:+ start:1128 stop:1307 length:180 start_codon:yes stop_codon:yes gene_type:complete
MKVRVLIGHSSYKKGDVITVDNLGVNEQLYWFKRIQQSGEDGNCEVVAEKSKKGNEAAK